MPFFNLPSGGAGGGAAVLTGNGAPSNSVGVDGQLYVDLQNKALYVKSAGDWGAGIDVGGAADWSELTGKPTEFPPATHSHVISDVAGLQTALDGKQPAGSYASATHSHVAADITDRATALVTSVNGQTGAVTITSDAPASAWEEIVNKPTTFPPSSHTHQVADVQNLQTILDGKADDSHGHAIADVSGLDTALSGKADAIHTHEIAAVNGLQAALDAAGVELSDTAALPLGTAAAGIADESARADHVHAMPTAADVGALTATSVIDGGDYIGVYVAPGAAGITVTTQPQNVSATIGAAQSQSGSLPSGIWNRELAYVNDRYMAVSSDATGGDYYATSTDGINWTKRYGLNRAASWRRAVYGGGKYAITNGTHAQISTDAIAWSESAISGTLHYANGKWFRYVDTVPTNLSQWQQMGLHTSDDLTTWSPRVTMSQTFVGGSFTNIYKPRNIAQMLYHNGRWIAICDAAGSAKFLSGSTYYHRGYAHVFTSTNASAWAAVESIAGPAGFSSNGWARTEGVLFRFGRAVIANNEVWISGGSYDGQPTFAVSADGITWSLRTIFGPGSSYAPPQVAYGNGVYVVAYGNEIHTSTNGQTWIERYPPAAWSGGYSSEVNFIDGYFWIVDLDETQALRSANGVDWTLVEGLSPFFVTSRLAVGNSLVSVNTGTGPTQSVKLTFSASTAVATFTVSAIYAGGTLAYQWQRSVDAGSTWENVADATAPTLSFTATAADNGNRYRCQISAAGAQTITTNSATLTIS